MLTTTLSVALGGAIGATLRYLVGIATLRLAGPGFPWGTLTVNVAGSAAMGALVVILAQTSGTRFAPFLMTGLLGGFTTFSAFSLDTIALIERGATGQAALYVAASLALSVAALFAAMTATRMVWP